MDEKRKTTSLWLEESLRLAVEQKALDLSRLAGKKVKYNDLFLLGVRLVINAPDAEILQKLLEAQ